MFRSLLRAMVVKIALAAPAAGAELQNCFVERIPCGTPAQLAETIRRCLASPTLCREGGAAPVVAVHAPTRAAAPPMQEAVERGARALDLPPALRELRDAVPPEPAAVMQRLRLRPPAVAAVDLRHRTPSVEDLRAALLP